MTNPFFVLPQLGDKMFVNFVDTSVDATLRGDVPISAVCRGDHPLVGEQRAAAEVGVVLDVVDLPGPLAAARESAAHDPALIFVVVRHASVRCSNCTTIMTSC